MRRMKDRVLRNLHEAGFDTAELLAPSGSQGDGLVWFRSFGVGVHPHKDGVGLGITRQYLASCRRRGMRSLPSARPPTSHSSTLVCIDGDADVGAQRRLEW
jgi:hypothetical protein